MIKDGRENCVCRRLPGSQKNEDTDVPHDYSAYPGKSEAFVPNFLLKEWMVGAVVLVGFMVLVLSHAGAARISGGSDQHGFIPMPDWYFLFMYQLLKYPYMAENLIVFGTVIVPGLAFGALLLAPFLDTGKERRFLQTADRSIPDVRRYYRGVLSHLRILEPLSTHS